MTNPLLQEILLGDKQDLPNQGWRMLVGCMLLNNTTRVQVDKVWPELFERWPTAWHWLSGSERDQRELLRPLGFVNVRWHRITRFSYAWTQRSIGFRVKDLPGCGQYAQDSWDIFVCGLGEEVNPTDKELRRYLDRQNDGPQTNDVPTGSLR